MTRCSALSNGFWMGTVSVGLMVAAGCTPDVKDIREAGIQQYQQQRYLDSMATFRYALELAPNDALSNYYMGLNYRLIAARKFKEGDVSGANKELDTAIIYFTQAVTSVPNFVEAIAAKNEALEARGKYAEALNLAEKLAQRIPGDQVMHFIYLGNQYRDQGDYDNALRAYKIALTKNPDSASAYAGLGRLYQIVGDKAKAIEAYSRAYELNRNEPGVAAALELLRGGK
jgi:tetratricopeptide (TPR) repeat protein